jgi:galactokinase
MVEREFVARFRKSPSLWAQAPGRVDLMGSHTDYNEGYVLTLAVDRNTWLAARPRDDRKVEVYSLNMEGGGAFDLDEIGQNPDSPWTDYVRGVAAVFQAEGYTAHGFDGLIHSTIPFGSGLSSSAALEVVTAFTLKALAGDWEIEPLRLATLCQRAENRFVGMKCGILDQYSSVFGQAGHALLLDCRNLTHRTVALPDDLRVVICDTRVGRKLTGSEYGERRTQCEEGASLLAHFYRGVTHLRDLTPEQFAAREADLPEAVARRCRFVIEENLRVLHLASALAADDRAAMRRLTESSYAGARDLYEISSPAMEAMMQAMRTGPGLVCGRQAGAGFGGCMVALVEDRSVEGFADSVVSAYRSRTGTQPEIYPVRAAPGAGLLTFPMQFKSP